VNFFEKLLRSCYGDSSVTVASFSCIDLERDLDLERRKNRDLQETSRERDKEYQKLKV
jgi:E3 ubiquitin-protein ligase CCNP1IP1